MKSKWQLKKLDEIAYFNPKETLLKGTIAKKIAMETLIPFCRDVSNYELAPFNGGTKFKNGDTIMARITPCLENGKTSKVSILDDDEIGFGSTEYIVFRAKSETDEDFLYYLITSNKVRDPAIKSMVGSSGRQRVQTDVIANLEIEVPPYNEQKKIGNFLKLIDDKIALNNKINKNLEEQAKCLYHQMFVEKQSAKSIKGTLSDIADITMGQSPAGHSYNEDRKGTVFFQGRAEFGSRFPVIRLYTTDPKRMAQPNDILMSVRAPVGDMNVALVMCCIGRGLAAIHSKNNQQSYMLYTMASLKKQLDVFNGEGTVFGSINSQDLKNLQIVIPPSETIEEFEKIVAPIDAEIRSNHEQNQYLTQLRNILLPKLMSGEIDLTSLDI